MNFFNIMIIFVITVLASACKSGPAPCFNGNKSDVQLKFGDYVSNNRTYAGYKIFPNGLVQTYTRDTAGTEIGEDIGYLSNKDVCKALSLYYWGMKKVQVCYEPGDNLKYLTLINDKSNTYWNVIWNNNFSTGSNKILKIAYDSLNSIIQRIEK